MQHTPGPWRIDEEQGQPYVIDEQDAGVCTVWRQPLDPPEWADASARLIAAAPDLLAALESVQSAMLARDTDKSDAARFHRYTLVSRDVAAAIAKAKGA